MDVGGQLLFVGTRMRLRPDAHAGSETGRKHTT